MRTAEAATEHGFGKTARQLDDQHTAVDFIRVTVGSDSRCHPDLQFNTPLLQMSQIYVLALTTWATGCARATLAVPSGPLNSSTLS